MDLFNDCDELEYVDIVDTKQSAIIAIIYFGLIQIIKIIIEEYIKDTYEWITKWADNTYFYIYKI